MANSRLRRLVRSAEGVTYWAAAAPVLAHLPASVGYRVACWRGDRLFRSQATKRTELTGNLRQVFGRTLSPAAARQVTREWFRLASCEAIDVMRLRHSGRPLRQLVEIRGREHLEAALAVGKGAIVCSAHFGSYDCGFSVLGASGFPVTTIGRWQHKYTANLSSAERRLWDRVYARPLRRHRRRPNIEPWAGRFEVAAQAASVLRANEVVTIAIDAPPLDSDLARVVEVPFLGRSARLLPGVVTLAQVTGAPLLMAFLYRCADYRHQVLEISAPVPVTPDAATAFGRCAAEVSAAIARSPAHWVYWASTADLGTLGLTGKEQEKVSSPVTSPQAPTTSPPPPPEAQPLPDPQPLPDKGFPEDRAVDNVTTSLRITRRWRAIRGCLPARPGTQLRAGPDARRKRRSAAGRRLAIGALAQVRRLRSGGGRREPPAARRQRRSPMPRQATERPAQRPARRSSARARRW